MKRCSHVGLGFLSLLLAVPAAAHDIELPKERLQKEINRLQGHFTYYLEHPTVGGAAANLSPAEAVGMAEIEASLGRRDRALEILMGRISDPDFRNSPFGTEAALFVSQLLEEGTEHIGAMFYAEEALRLGGEAEQMAEAGARWFRVARRAQRTDRQQEIYSLWRQQGGADAAGSEAAAQALYQMAYAARARGDRRQAHEMLRKVPSDSHFGSRATYLAGVLFVEDGDLESAEKWFAAVMDWALPANANDPRRKQIEVEVRELAALSTGRLRYERGDLEGANVAYRRIDDESKYQREACWERAHLDVQRGRNRGAMLRIQCVKDLGARGSRVVDIEIKEAQLLAHLGRYEKALAVYNDLHQDLVKEHKLFNEAMASVPDASEYLFAGVERVTGGEEDIVSPGPPTLFADAWTPDLDRGYRVDRGVGQAGIEIAEITAEVTSILGLLASDQAFTGLEFRRKTLEGLLREVRHLEGHAGDLASRAARPTASLSNEHQHSHSQDAEEVLASLNELRELGRSIELELVRTEHEGVAIRKRARRLVSGLMAELQALQTEAQALGVEAEAPVDMAAKDAIHQVEAHLSDAVMRAEFGVLDTFWVKKQHRTRAIEKILERKDETKRQVQEALRTLE